MEVCISLTQRLTSILIRNAKKSHCRYKHAAVIIYKGKIISVGYNQSLIKGKESNHAEAVVCRKIPKGVNPKDCILIVVRINSTGFANSKPCTSCEAIIKKIGIGLVLHS